MSLLITKLHPPPRREQTIARDHLVERLRSAPGIKLTVVAAPAGSGKTTLLGAWREVEEAERPVAWLSLDEGDNDPVLLWSYVLAALRSAVPALDVSSAPEVIGARRVGDIFLPELVNALTTVGDVALVLDDFHRLSSGPARDSVAWFINHAPSTLRLVLGTRSEPGLRLATLRAHAALLELRATDLAFTLDEAEDLLNDRLGLGLQPESVKGLVEQTEGWPAGLYLAALSLQAVDDRDAFVSKFGGESRHVVDFLVDEVLEAHDRATQDLMLRASILERFCGPLCDALLEQEGSDELLSGLARSNLFLIPLDDRGTWYRFHHLFAQLLCVELDHREPGLTPTLHRRAYGWFRDQGSLDEAIHHALEAHAFAEAGELVAAAWAEYETAGRHTTVLAWLDRFPAGLLREDARLLLVHAWVLSLDGRREEAGNAIAALEQLEPLDPGPLPDGFSSIESSLATLRGTIPWGDFGVGLENARRAAELEGPTSPWRPLVCLAVGGCLYYSGEFVEARRWLAESADPALARGYWTIATGSLAIASLAVGELGLVEEQTLLAEQALEVARDHGLEEVEVELFTAVGASLQNRGRFDEALAAFERGVFAARRTAHPRTLTELLMRQAALLQAMGRPNEAAPLLEEARVVVDSCADPRILADWLPALERQPKPRPPSQNDELSRRELVILRMLGGRLSENDIGRELYISRNTVHSHTKSIYRKLGASSRSEALRHARELGLI